MAYLDHTYGIEIECYLPQGGSQTEVAAAITERLGNLGTCAQEHYNHANRPYWKIVTDGSLGDYQRGIEIVSPILRGAEGFEAINRVMGALNDYGCTVSRSCGLHVHVGAGNGEMTFFKKLLKLYAVYEPVIDSFMPQSRRESRNSYCRSMTSAAPNRVDMATDLNGLLRIAGGESRYYKLNLTAYRTHRTVEFRQHSGTLDAAKACNWTKFCLRMVEAARAGEDIPSGVTTSVNHARPGSKSHLVGQMMMRPEGVTGPEACAATGWPAISLPQQARTCGINFTTRRMGRMVRYYAQTAPAASPLAITLEALLDRLGCEQDERTYFQARTTSMSGAVQWAA